MQPVWVLSVDLQTKTATFQSGLSDAAKSARGAFTQIKSGAGDMSRDVSTNMFEARHGVMLLGEEFGVHLPRALTSFIASIGPIGAAMEAAFPFLAVAVGATLLIEHLAKLRAAGLQLTEDQEKFGTAAQNAFNKLEDKIIQSKIRADELNHDSMGALRLQLELIDHQSLDELVHSFEEVEKAADVVFKGLKTSWYQFGAGSEGAHASLERFKTQYESLLAQGKSEEASGLLSSVLKREQKILELQKQYTASQSRNGTGGDYAKFEEASNGLKKMGISISGVDAGIKGEIASQQQLVDALNAQAGIEQRIAQLKQIEGDNTKHAAANAQAGVTAAAQREAAEHQQRMGEMAISSDRAVAKSQLDINRASVEERLKSDIDFADREQALHLAANQAEIAGLDKSGKDYANRLQALKDKALEITAKHESQVTELTARAATEAAARTLRNMEQAEREKVEAIQKGSAARIAALDAAIKEEESKGLQDTAHYRELLNQRVEALRQMKEEEAKLRAEAGRESAEHDLKMGELILAAQKQHQAMLNSAHHVSDAQRVAQETAAANAEYQAKLKAFQKEEAALDKSGKDYANKLKQLQDKEKQLTQQHENEITAIKEKAEMERNKRILSADKRATDEIANGLTKSIMGHQSWAKTVNQLGEAVVEGMIKNSLKMMMQHDKDKLGDAKSAAATAYNNGVKAGGPFGAILGPVFAAAAFAGVMAFERGGIVPGTGSGDIVPAMLTPGEGVVPKGVMEGLSNLSKSGGLESGGTHYHVRAHFAPTVHAVDAAGVDRMLEKHGDRFQRHFEGALRKMNR